MPESYNLLVYSVERLDSSSWESEPIPLPVLPLSVLPGEMLPLHCSPASLYSSGSSYDLLLSSHVVCLQKKYNHVPHCYTPLHYRIIIKWTERTLKRRNGSTLWSAAEWPCWCKQVPASQGTWGNRLKISCSWCWQYNPRLE